MTLVLLMESGTAGVPTNASVRQFVETESKSESHLQCFMWPKLTQTKGWRGM